jgi:hypothetical protein
MNINTVPSPICVHSSRPNNFHKFFALETIFSTYSREYVLLYILRLNCPVITKSVQVKISF